MKVEFERNENWEHEHTPHRDMEDEKTGPREAAGTVNATQFDENAYAFVNRLFWWVFNGKNDVEA